MESKFNIELEKAMQIAFDKYMKTFCIPTPRGLSYHHLPLEIKYNVLISVLSKILD